MALPAFQKIKERKVVQWGIAYLAGAWLVLQVVVALGGVYGWPSWLLRATPVLLGAGLFGALVLAWFHGEKGHQRVTGIEIGLLGSVLALAGIGVAVLAPSGDPASGSEAVDIEDLDRMTEEQALELAYDWGIGGNMDASMTVLDHLIDRAESDSLRMTYLATGASLLSREKRQDEAVSWMLRLLAIDPVSLTLASDAGPEITRGYLEALRRHYASTAGHGRVRSIAMLPQSAYMVGFPDSLSDARAGLADGIPAFLQIQLADALETLEIPVLERAALDSLYHGPIPIQNVRVGLPGSDWLWVDERAMPGGFTRASHYVLCYCTYLGEPFESGGVASMTCSALLLSTEGTGIRASAQSRGDLTGWSDFAEALSSRLAGQIKP